MSIDAPFPVRVGLRFDRSALPRLRELTVAGLRYMDTGVYVKAIEATEHGDALTVLAEDHDEVRRIVALFALLGCGEPVVEELNG